jgi:hypothetical protein
VIPVGFWHIFPSTHFWQSKFCECEDNWAPSMVQILYSLLTINIIFNIAISLGEKWKSVQQVLQINLD